MITIKEFPNQRFNSKEEVFKALKENKGILITQKKNIIKHADPVFVQVESQKQEEESQKQEANSEQPTAESERLRVKIIINTTNLIDSHDDLHTKGIWTKSVQEQRNILLLQEHKMAFDKIISDKVNASVKEMNWQELGLGFVGTTEALTFEAEIDKERNPFMFEQYRKGYVKEHSVGMRYVKMALAINSEDKYYREEKEIWDKYYSEVANKSVADENGYFWVVTEAKIIEGSAVVKGSNPATPTLSVEAVKDTCTDKEEPSADTQKTNKEPRKMFNPNLY